MKGIAAAAQTLTLFASFAIAQSGAGRDPAALTKLWAQQNENCRGGHGDDPRTDAACAARETYYAKLRVIGWCYGKRGQLGYQMSWHKCGPDSLK